jgi:hypothetical protein
MADTAHPAAAPDPSAGPAAGPAAPASRTSLAAAVRRLARRDVKRLGKPGAYRLGELRVLGSPPHRRRTPREPSFGARRSRADLARWPSSCAAVAVLLGLAAWLGIWWLPFVAGLAAGLTPWRARSALCWAALAVIAGWGVALWIPALTGAPAGVTAREVAALAGLPPYAFVAVAATLLVGVLQAAAALWLTRAILPRPPRSLLVTRAWSKNRLRLPGRYVELTGTARFPADLVDASAIKLSHLYRI